jgi:photosystem II stability/assembly factor-like uncharacterized protein
LILRNGELQINARSFSGYLRIVINRRKTMKNIILYLSLILLTINSNAQNWKALPVHIERSDCYATGQKGVFRTLAVHPKDANTVLTGAANGGMWKTTDKGKTWIDVIKNIPICGVTNHIEFSEANPNIVYAAIESGIIKSQDAGSTWKYTTMDNSKYYPKICVQSFWGNIYKLYNYVDIAPSNPEHIVATNFNPLDSAVSIVKSTDGGKIWEVFELGKDCWVHDLKFHPNNDQLVYAVIKLDNHIHFLRSDDGGSTFAQDLKNKFPVYEQKHRVRAVRYKLAVTPANPDFLACYMNVPAGTAFYTSEDAGLSFTKTCCGSIDELANKSNNDRDYYGEGFGGVQIIWATTFAISDIDPNFIGAATNVQPRYSFDGLKTWYWKPDFKNGKRPKNVYEPGRKCGTYLHGDIHKIIIKGDDVWVCNDGGICLSEDRGQTYHEVADGIPSEMVLGFDNTPGTRDIIAIALDHNGTIVRDESIYGNEWKPFGGGDASFASINPINDMVIWHQGSGTINRPSTKSHGKPKWNTSTVSLGSGYSKKFNTIQVHPNSYNTLFAINYKDGGSIVKSTDNGTSWSSIENFYFENKGLEFGQVRIAETNPDVMYATLRNSMNSKVIKTEDGGASWKISTPKNKGFTENGVRNIEVSSSDPNVLWVSLSGYQDTVKVLKSTDGGANWEDYSFGLPKYNIISMIHQRGTDGGVYVGTMYGVYYRNATMDQWKLYGTGMPANDANFLKINYAKELLRVGTPRGLWEIALYESSKPQALISVNKNEILPKDTVSFASLSVISYKNNVEYSWSFEGGSPKISNEERPKVMYKKSGRYNVILNIADKNGTSTSTLNEVIIVKK